MYPYTPEEATPTNAYDSGTPTTYPAKVRTERSIERAPPADTTTTRCTATEDPPGWRCSVHPPAVR
jgi:hypothetical protein